jgi:phenylacetate-CoA ligase
MMPDNKALFFDRQEVRAAAEREAAIFHALPGLLRHALDNAPGMAAHLHDVEPDRITSRLALQGLPILDVAALLAGQSALPPFGGMVATPIGRLARVLAGARGQLVPEGARVDYWRFARAFFAAGVRRADLVWNALPHHLGALAAMAETGARALSCTVVPAGPAVDPACLDAIRRLRPSVFVGEAPVLEALLEALDRTHSFRCALLVGPVPDPAFLVATSALHAVETFFVYATDEVGLIAYETNAHEGLVVDESVIVELLSPAGSHPVADGEEGQIVVTVFNPDFPLIRLRTGDRARTIGGESPCGRTNLRITPPLPEAPPDVEPGGNA